jgi:5'-3' exonuclease
MLHIIDTNNFSYHIAFAAHRVGLLKKSPELQNYTIMNAAHLITGGFYNNPDVKEARYLFASDSKPYWRYAELKKLGVIYKGKRGSGKVAYSEFIPLITTYLESFLAKNNIYMMYRDGYEADDIASAVSQVSEGNTNLITSDFDWIPLANRKGITWCNTRVAKVRSLHSGNALNFIKNHKSHNSTIAQREFTASLTRISDLWRWKARFGDSSDNIPADKECSDKFLPFIDLHNPPDEYNLLKQKDFMGEIGDYISKPIPQRTHDEFVKNRLPYDLALFPIDH